MKISPLLLTTLIFLIPSCVLCAQEINFSQKPKDTILVFREGSVFMNFKDKKILKEDMIVSLNTPLGLPEQYSFTLFNESKDFLGFEHMAYQQLYLGIPIEEGMILLHAKDGFVTSLNCG